MLVWTFSLKETSIYVVDEMRRVVKEGKVGSKSETIAVRLEHPGLEFERVGLDTGSLTPVIHDGPAIRRLTVFASRRHLRQR